jgi:hypothetical protein
VLDQIIQTLAYEDGIKDIYQSLVDKEGLEQKCHDRGRLAQDKYGSIEPGTGAVEDGEKRNLREIGEDEEDGGNEGREECDRK